MSKDIEWPRTFSAKEWPGDTANKLSASVLNALFKVRDFYGHGMIPSPLERAHIREETGTSRHQAPAHDATDLFLPSGDVAGFLKAAQRVPEINGIGIYLDREINGRTLPLVHLDTRPANRIMWIQSGRGEPYIYEHTDPASYYKILSDYLSRVS